MSTLFPYTTLFRSAPACGREHWRGWLPTARAGEAGFQGDRRQDCPACPSAQPCPRRRSVPAAPSWSRRSEEHTSELQSRLHLVCRLLLEKKKNVLCRYSLVLHKSSCFLVPFFSFRLTRLTPLSPFSLTVL